jgi:tetratricopeptide (TPR) repeat protein
MKKFAFLNRLNRVSKIRLFRSKLSLMLLLSLITCLSCSAKTDKSVIEAFELRINGKTDQAKELLLTIIKKDSTNAAAQFELARTLDYINIMGSPESSKALKAALKYDPGNVVYAYYNARSSFLKAYIAMEQAGDNVKNLINDACNEYLKVLKLKPDYPEALMYLVEIYGMLPENMGGDKVKAEEYARKLEKTDKFYGAKARLVLMPEGTDMVKYWKNYIVENDNDCRAWKELGVANIFNDSIETAKESFEKAIALDNSQNIRLLDLARYYIMKVMQNKDVAAIELPKAKEYIEQYLVSKPKPIPPLNAYALGNKAQIEMFLGNNAEAENIMEKAKALDPYFSQAFGIPWLGMFEAPDKLDHHFLSFFSPF